MRTFLKKPAVPSVFPWMKSKTQAQLDREKREQKRHETESKVLRLAEQRSTDRANKDEEEEENTLYAEEAFRTAAE